MGREGAGKRSGVNSEIVSIFISSCITKKIERKTYLLLVARYYMNMYLVFSTFLSLWHTFTVRPLLVPCVCWWWAQATSGQRTLYGNDRWDLLPSILQIKSYGYPAGSWQKHDCRVRIQTSKGNHDDWCAGPIAQSVVTVCARPSKIVQSSCVSRKISSAAYQSMHGISCDWAYRQPLKWAMFE